MADPTRQYHPRAYTGPAVPGAKAPMPVAGNYSPPNYAGQQTYANTVAQPQYYPQGFEAQASYGGYPCQPSQYSEAYGQDYYAPTSYPQAWTQPSVPPPLVTTGTPPMAFPTNSAVPAPMVTTIQPGLPLPKAGMPKPGLSPTSYVLQQPVQPAAPKPVRKVHCNACNQDVPDTDMYDKKCDDPNHSVCTECVNKAYIASDSPACPFCKREYSEVELGNIHQLLQFNDAYKGQIGAEAKRPGAGVMELCVFGHQTNKVNIIPNACKNNCKVCRAHYTAPQCMCGQILGVTEDLSQFEKE